MSWTEEKVEKLKELWGKGSTASQIAIIIGEVSRNVNLSRERDVPLLRRHLGEETWGFKSIIHKEESHQID